jgi:predicted TIM-barrel fold metal-dependent hydrolase
MNNAPDGFLKLYMPPAAAGVVDKFTNTQLGSFLIQKLAGLNKGLLKRYATFLQIGKSKGQIEVFEDLVSRYKNESIDFVALSLNMENLGVGNSKTGFEGQLEEIIDIKRKYPDRILPFFGLDPRWLNSGSEIKNKVEQYFNTKINVGGSEVYPFQGLKIYPSTGFYVFDEKLKETFEWAAKNGVPVMAHTYYLGGIFNYDKNYITNHLNPYDPYTKTQYTHPKFITEKGSFFGRLLGTQATKNCKYSCSYFLDPASYISVLDYFKESNLKICLAHFSGVAQIKASKGMKSEANQKKPFGITDKNWYDLIREMLAEYPNLYTDISFDVAEAVASENQFLYEEFYKELNKPFGNRILFGTDYFMTEKENLEEDSVAKFRAYANTKILDNGNTMWDQLAKINPSNYLQSTYY